MEICYLNSSDHVYLQCQVRACLRHSCQPSCAMPDQGRLMPDFDLTNKSYDEIIYEEEPEYELGDHAMLKRYGDSQHQSSKSLVCIV